MNWNNISQQISNATRQNFTARSVQSLTGGDINKAFRLQDGQRSYFVKLNRPELVAMFAAEFLGLQELARSQTVRVPTPVIYGQSDTHSFLVLEYIELERGTASSERLLGQQLAQLHQQTQAYFGWYCDNTIGSTLQVNQHRENWLSFWHEHRLDFQLKLAAKNGYGGRLQVLGKKLGSELSALFVGYQPKPSLLHGDLWAGNAASDIQGNPVIFDPACYYGDRETDLAMTELFGGFGSNFYAAYQDVWALHDGYRIRKSLYSLYHILNHLNLFDGGYLQQAENRMVMLLAEIGVRAA